MRSRRIMSILPILALALSAGCGESAKTRSQGVEELDANKRRGDDGLKIAQSTGRIALSGPVMNLQAIRRDLDAVPVSECLGPAKEALGKAQDLTINGFLEFMGDSKEMVAILMAAGRAKEALYEDARSLCLMPRSEAAREVAQREQAAAEVRARKEQRAAQALKFVGEMVTIPAGSFPMGSDNNDKNEAPQHYVTIAKPFALGKYEVTFAAYDAFAKATGRELPDDEGWGRGNLPVTNMGWEDATAYAKWLSDQTGRIYRLPTEAEWEYAARAGSVTAYPWGEKISRDHANYGMDKCCGGHANGKDQWENTAPVGSFPPNAFGLHDMHGNVWEWVEDCYQDSYEGAPQDGSARQHCDTDQHIIRGGSWHTVPERLRSAGRAGLVGGGDFSWGFRLAQDLE